MTVVSATDPARSRDRASGGAGAEAVLRRCRFPDPATGPVDLAVSGGPDSMALMVLARRHGLEGRAIHVDHGLRPGSDAESEVVARAARELDFEFERHRVSVEPGPDLEARARRARYEVLPAGVLTGHTMDDQAETVLLNVVRGAALDGLAGMRPHDRVRRPLIGLRRSETEEVCRAHGLDPVRDPSNLDPRYRRNRIRSEMVPLLSDIGERDVVPVIARQAEIAAADLSLLEDLASALDPCDTAALRAAPDPLARRALRRWLRNSQAGGGEAHPPSSAELSRVMEVVRGTRRACEVSGGYRVARSGGRLRIEPPGGLVAP